MDDPTAVHEIQSPTCVEPDDQRLRGREQTTAVEHVAHTAAGQMLQDQVRDLGPLDLLDTPVVDGIEVRVGQRRRGLGLEPEPGLCRGVGDELRHHDLHGDGAVELFVVGVEHDTVSARAPALLQPVASGQHATEKRRIGRHGHTKLSASPRSAGAARGDLAATLPLMSRPRDGAKSIGSDENVLVTSNEIEPVSNTLTVADDETDATPPSAPTTRQKAKRLAVSFAIAVGIVLVFVGVNTSVTGRDAQDLPAEIENTTPVRSAAQVLQQEQIIVDLITGYTGILIVNNVEIETFTLGESAAPNAVPGAQPDVPLVTIFEAGNSTLTYTPADGAPIEQFTTGVNTVQVRYWKIIDGPSRAKSFTWQFDVV